MKHFSPLEKFIGAPRAHLWAVLVRLMRKAVPPNEDRHQGTRAAIQLFPSLSHIEEFRKHILKQREEKSQGYFAASCTLRRAIGFNSKMVPSKIADRRGIANYIHVMNA